MTVPHVDVDVDVGSADPADDADTGGETHDRAREGLEHLQAAAHELIQAARAMLDVAEDVVDDPESVAHLVGTVGAWGDLLRQAAGIGSRPRASRTGDEGADGQGGSEGTNPADARVQRITVL